MWLSPLLIALLAAVQSGPPQAPADESALVGMSAAIDEYVALHRRLEGPVPTIRSSTDADEIRRAVRALGQRIRAERRDVRQGNIFTPQVAELVRVRIHEGCGGDLEAVHAAAQDETPPMPRAVVNGRWPGPAMTFMPPNVLCRLPALPEELEYRFVNRDLVLWDAHADVVVDVLRGALRR